MMNKIRKIVISKKKSPRGQITAGSEQNFLLITCDDDNGWRELVNMAVRSCASSSK